METWGVTQECSRNFFMINRDDLRFVRRAMQKGWITGEKIFECVEIVRTGRSSLSLRDLLLQLGYLNSQQVQNVDIDLTPTEEMENPLLVGEQRIASYELLEKIGEGAMGVVYRARHIESHKIVAVKLLNEEFAHDQTFVTRFLREAKNAAKLKNHENIVQAYDFGQDQGRYYFAMELIRGRSLAEILWQKKQLEERTALTIARQIARALQQAHKFSIIHRDIKPENIMISQEGIVKLCDLGLAKDTTQDLYRTSDGITLGTACYVSPEQALGRRNIDIRSDIYSLGITLYQMLTGELPFDENIDSIKTAQHHIHEEVPPIQLKNPRLSPGVIHLVHKMTAKNPDERHNNPADLIQEIDSLLSQNNPNPSPPISPRVTTQLKVLSKKKPNFSILGTWLYWVVGAMMIFLSFFWFWLWWSRQ